jgi:DNA-binding transcriptional MerR regulator
MAQQQPARRRMRSAKAPVTIPDKLYFRIGDVARLCSLPAYVLRFWETEFPQLKPHKGGSGQRLYRKRDVEMVLAIKYLLYDEGFTIAGARRSLGEKRSAVEERSALSAVELPNHTEPHPMRRKSDLVTAPMPGKVGRSEVGRSVGIAAVSARPAPNDARFGELRKEMRALLSMLGSDEKGHGPSTPAPIPPKKKDRKHADEPTLF